MSKLTFRRLLFLSLSDTDTSLGRALSPPDPHHVSEQTALGAAGSRRRTLGRKTPSGDRITKSCLCPFRPNLREIGDDPEEEILHFIEIALANTRGLVHQEADVCFELATDCGGKRGSL